MSSLTASTKKIRSKMKALEWTQHFPHYNPMGGIRCHARMKNIRSKMKALEWTQHYTAIFRRARADNYGVGVGIWPKFELIQAFMHVLVTNEDDRLENEGARVFTRFLPL